MCKVYLAARYGAKDDVEKLANTLRSNDIEVVSTWHSKNKKATPYNKITSRDMRKEALDDYADLTKADTIVACEIFGDGGSRGARHCEFGYGLGMEYTLVVYGERWQCFHYMPEVYIVKTERQLINALKRFVSTKKI